MDQVYTVADSARVYEPALRQRTARKRRHRIGRQRKSQHARESSREEWIAENPGLNSPIFNRECNPGGANHYSYPAATIPFAQIAFSRSQPQCREPAGGQRLQPAQRKVMYEIERSP